MSVDHSGDIRTAATHLALEINAAVIVAESHATRAAIAVVVVVD